MAIPFSTARAWINDNENPKSSYGVQHDVECVVLPKYGEGRASEGGALGGDLLAFVERYRCQPPG